MKALLEIRLLQKNSRTLHIKGISGVVRDILDTRKKGYQRARPGDQVPNYAREALDALREVADLQMSHTMEDATTAMVHAGRVQLKPSDLDCLFKLTREGFMPWRLQEVHERVRQY